jgi:hypothetical protein
MSRDKDMAVAGRGGKNLSSTMKRFCGKRGGGVRPRLRNPLSKASRTKVLRLLFVFMETQDSKKLVKPL